MSAKFRAIIANNIRALISKMTSAFKTALNRPQITPNSKNAPRRRSRKLQSTNNATSKGVKLRLKNPCMTRKNVSTAYSKGLLRPACNQTTPPANKEIAAATQIGAMIIDKKARQYGCRISGGQ
jgi:cobalamin biosynthesis protein CobT